VNVKFVSKDYNIIIKILVKNIYIYIYTLVKQKTINDVHIMLCV